MGEESTVPRRTLRQEVDDLKAERLRQGEHIDALHRMLDQLIEFVNEEAGADWRPDLAVMTALDLAAVSTSVRRGLRNAAAVASEANQRAREASES